MCSNSLIRRAAVLGYPVEHSRSPLIHRYWLKSYQLAGDYEKIAVPPDGLSEALKRLRDQGYIGFNVTIPHKAEAFHCADRLSDVAKKTGAVNTLWWDEDGLLCGDNTDGYGFLANLDHRQPGWDRQTEKAVVIGAGGAALAIIQSLLTRGVQTITLINRTYDKACALAARTPEQLTATPWQNHAKALAEADLLVNTSALGMKGFPPLILNLASLPDQALVTDIVYTPLDTGLLLGARERGLNTVDGLGMLLHQAVPGFERWFGVRPEVTESLRAMILSDLGGG